MCDRVKAAETRIAVLVSGGGTNLQALIDASGKNGLGGGRLSLVISSSPGAYALRRAESAGITTLTIPRRDMTAGEFDGRLCEALLAFSIDLVVLAGFMAVLGQRVLARFDGRIINVHPSLIPSFCGPGMYGLKVHEAALGAGVKVTGATVHFVNEVVDGGRIILQKAVEVLPDDTPEILQRRVMEEAEWVLLPRAVALFCRGQAHITREYEREKGLA
ncbi:MAG: phosphoribosylglycinamide formyltransferase [Oscillospiraceae bacterium]|nr:phosphoribosylglycinamide formyltransferase [Oscillospiraceae bacterium]